MRLTKVFRSTFCGMISFLSDLSGIRFSFALCVFPTEKVFMEEEGSFFFFFVTVCIHF